MIFKFLDGIKSSRLITRCSGVMGAASKKLRFPMPDKYMLRVTLVTLFVGLQGCASSREYISVEENFKEPKTATGFHRVQPGETLYSIAWRYGVDFKELANTNSIRSPYVIHPGQKIDTRIQPSVAEPVSKPRVGKSSKPTPIKRTVVNKPKKTIQITPKIERKLPEFQWQWPLSGRLVKGFSSKKPANKGIDLKGRLGESVMAASAGTVVYAGQGLRGYGNLIIIKHDEEFLSAYAHASTILVSENDAVRTGQSIATIDSSGSEPSILHFEIRRYGKPVNPLIYLPKR